jgi:hypothetical protein
MHFEHNKELSVTARKRLMKGLTKVAELYFSDKYLRYDVVPDTVNIGCGICKAMLDLGYKHSYDDMNKLMLETLDYSYGYYVSTPEEWEPRANMCLFLVEYLKDTIKKEKA